MKSYDKIIIGGGAAGMTAAIMSARGGAKTLLIERNAAFGRKLAITGKGRCNVTNNSDNRAVMANIPRNASFMYSALARFSAADVMAFFEELGVPLKTERGNRVFPVSDKAGDIVSTLAGEMRRLNIETVTDRAVEILAEGGAVCGVRCTHGAFAAPKVVIATGGLSYPVTGSTGDGYALAEKCGHTVVKPRPALVPLETVENLRAAAGLSLRNITLTLRKNGGKAVYKEQGELMFMAYGVSGPLTLSASSYIEGNPAEYTLEINFKPALDDETLNARILRDFAEAKSKPLAECLRKLLPAQMIAPFLTAAGLDGEKNISVITKEERGKIRDNLKRFTLHIKRFRPIDEAIITDGGVSVKEINPKTMESKIMSGLYFCGEVIDVTGFTGGYNLQIAFSTAALAGEN